MMEERDTMSDSSGLVAISNSISIWQLITNITSGGTSWYNT